MAVLTAEGTFRQKADVPTTDTTGAVLLVTTAHPSLLTHRDPRDDRFVHPSLGRLLQPRHTSSADLTADAGVPWACDNDCFNGLDAEAFTRMLDRVEGLPGCRFVTVPDVVRCVYCELTVDGYGGGEACSCEFGADRPKIVFGDAALTARRFEEWAPALERRGLPVALVLQDGLESPELAEWLERTWHRLDAVFVGGSTEWKLGPDAAAIAREAKARGKWVHWGRVNTLKRIDYCVGTGACDSLDGSKWARFRTTYLDAGLEYVREASEFPMLELDADPIA